MRKTAVAILLLAILALLFCSFGCGDSSGGGEIDNGDDNGVTQTNYDVGLVEGYAQGYDRGYTDGVEGTYDPEPDTEEGWDDDYAAGFREGYLEGYEDGYDDAVEEKDSEVDETAQVQEAMLAFVRENSAPGMEFRIENIVINGNEAAGRAVCTSETLESPYVIMQKGPSGWYGVDFGTGIEPPEWYPY